MAIDNTPPRLRLIVTIAIIVVITLVGLDFVFKSYYAYMSDEAHREKLAPTTDYNAQVAAEQAAFAGAKMPVDQAIAQLKTRSDLIEPKPSDDVGAMTGWSKLPKQAPLPAPGAAHGGDLQGPSPTAADGGPQLGDSGVMAADGGPLASDAGIGTSPTDSGAPAPKAPAPPPTSNGPGGKPTGAHAPPQH
jgi:hypothetical protein